MTKFNNTELEEFICQAYLNRTHTITELQNKFNIYPVRIYKILRKHNIELRGSNLPKEKALQICEEYKSLKCIKQISKELSVSESTISNIIKKYKIETRKSTFRFPKKYSLDDTILENIDTFEKAQFLGLIYSDGSLSKYNKNISIRLREDDKEYLEDWKLNFLKSNKPLGYTYKPETYNAINKKTYKNTYGSYILDITSAKVYKDALKIGLCTNKSKANLPMPDIRDDLKIAFIMGLFEGDGCVTHYTANKCRSFSIACQEKMGLDIKKYFDSIGIFSSFYKRKYICIVAVRRKADLKKIYDMFYMKSMIYMKRKKNKFELILNAF